MKTKTKKMKSKANKKQKSKKSSNQDSKCPNKRECIIKTWIDGKEIIHQCEVCSKIINIE